MDVNTNYKLDQIWKLLELVLEKIDKLEKKIDEKETTSQE